MVRYLWNVGIIAAVIAFSLLPVAAEEIQITYYHRSNTAETEWAHAVIDRFHKLHPNIQVQSLPSGTGGGAPYVEKLALLRASEDPPDVFFGSTDKLGYILKGWALDLTPFVERDKAQLNIGAFFPGVWETFERNGRIYGIPLTVTPQILYYNRGLFAARGLPQLPVSWEDRTWTWQRFVEYSKKLTVLNPDGSAAQLAITRAGPVTLPDNVWRFGGDWFAREAYQTGVATRATMATDANVRAYETLRDYYARYAAAGPDKGISAGRGFQEGLTAMDWVGTHRVSRYMKIRESGAANFEWAIAPVPLAENRQNTRWTDPLYISSTTPHPEAAWEFVKFATGEEGQKLWAQIKGAIPARRSVVGAFVHNVQDATGMSESDVISVISGAVAHGRRSLEESISAVQVIISNHAGEWLQPMLRGEVSVLSALTSMEKALNGILTARYENQ